MNFQNQSPTPSPSGNQRVGVAKPAHDISRKIKGFLYSLIGKRIKKMRPKREEGFHTSLEEFDVRKLIRLYYKHENLYNPRHSYYGNKDFAEDCFNDMARSIPGKTGFELRSYIENLRYEFEQQFRIIDTARRNKEELPTPTFRYYNEFLFLVPYLYMEFNQSHGETGTSSQNPPNVQNPASDMPNHRLNHFTGFPLAAFPGNICCSPKEMLRRTFKKDVKNKSKSSKISDQEKQMPSVTFSPSAEERSNDVAACSRDSKMSLTSSHYGDEQDLKTTDLTCPFRLENSPCPSECRLSQFGYSKSATTSQPKESMKSIVESVTPVVQQAPMNSSIKHPSETSQKGYTVPAPQFYVDQNINFRPQQSVAESFAAEEQEKFMIAHPPYSAAVGQQKPMKPGSKAPSESQVGASGPDNKSCPCCVSEERKEPAPEDKRDNPLVAKYQNFKQVQMLCDMIRTELTAAPDFIYFDAKWRIIEILREVHKRQLVHLKAGPQKNAVKEQLNQLKMQHHPYKPPKNTPAPPAKPGPSRICNHIKGSHCPYCCHNNRSLEMEAFFSSSKLIKHWPTCLIGLILLGILKFVLSRRKESSHRYTLDNKELVEGMSHNLFGIEDSEDTDELQPALEERPHVPFIPGQNLNPNGAEIFYNLIRGRRSIRSFCSQRKPDLSVIEDCIRAAGTAPSGAHTEPWTFCVVESEELKQSIREIVEQEELINYNQRMHPQWVTDLRPLQTNHVKEYLTDAPYLILIFKQTYGLMDDGRRKRHYYNEISTSIAAGILLCALQAAGLSSLVTTPLNCGPALRSLLNRPVNEKLLILLPVGYASEGCQVPDLERKQLKEILVKF
ncbi:uncharacterized protein LOC110185196 [Drosophila serrata]|uniref:uncharacterized protein LOC110185196 n=1 Tax=Drosophila serrata TaxID=7274 RepID=UPI000A1CFB3F|nr:uncharacterized protein LOC110185196 [Drosophila serrata]